MKNRRHLFHLRTLPHAALACAAAARGIAQTGSVAGAALYVQRVSIGDWDGEL
jgi:hypothetical protein